MDRVVVEQQRGRDGGWLEVHASADTDLGMIVIELREFAIAPTTTTRGGVVDGVAGDGWGEPTRHADLHIEVTVSAPLAAVAAALDRDGNGGPVAVAADRDGNGGPAATVATDRDGGQAVLDAMLVRFRGDGRAAVAWVLALPAAIAHTHTRRIDR